MEGSRNGKVRHAATAPSLRQTNNAAPASLRTVGTDTSVASIKFTGLFCNTEGDSDSSNEDDSREVFPSATGKNKNLLASKSTAATVRFMGLIDDGQDSDSSQESDDDSNPFTSKVKQKEDRNNPFYSGRGSDLSYDETNPFTSRDNAPTSDDETNPFTSKTATRGAAISGGDRIIPKIKTSISAEPIARQRAKATQPITRQLSLSSEIIPIDLNVSENHYALPEKELFFFKDERGPRTIAELVSAIEIVKKQVTQATPHTDQAKDLTRKLVQLRLKLLDANESSTVADNSVKRVMAHQFQERPWGSAKGYCEKCNGMIIGIVQTWFRCTVCGFCCHKRCLNLITRTCAGQKVSENPTYIVNICPEKGLHAQNYRCAECRAVIGFQTTKREARLCDYNGLFYCNHCHWNDTMVIMSRVLGNWDFQPRKICRSSKQILKLMIRKAVVRVQDINPMLFSYLEELNEVKKLREEILIMKKYFVLCKAALSSRLLVQLQGRQHFVDNSDMYSVQDLIDLANDVLLPELTKIHASFAQHIKVDCEVCRAKGYVCLICNDAEILFPFDNCAFVCPHCSYVVHRHCYVAKSQRCPKCQRNPALTSES